MNRTTALVATIILALLSLTVGAQVYRWVDKDGKVQYSDQPPPPGAGKAEATRINSSSPAPSAPAPAKPADKAGDKSADKGKDAGKVVDAQKSSEADKAKQAKEMETFCNDQRGNLRMLQDGGRISRTSADGERSYMSDEQIAAEIARTQATIAERCK
jgi:Domain of unknown function (DUF4124)